MYMYFLIYLILVSDLLKKETLLNIVSFHYSRISVHSSKMVNENFSEHSPALLEMPFSVESPNVRADNFRLHKGISGKKDLLFI